MDIGGRYECADGDIWFTIAREFCEETYHMAAITRRDVMDLAEAPGALSYVTDRRGRPVYISLAVHADSLRERRAVMDPDEFRSCRERVVRGNPEVPASVYSTTELLYLPWDAVAQGGHPPIGERLRQVLGSPRLLEASKKGR